MSSQPSSAFPDAPETPSLFHPVTPGPELLESAAGTLRMLAEPTRLQLLWQLAQGPKSVTELVDEALVPRTVVSQHLAKLRLSGLVDTRKDGRHVIYSLHDGHLLRVIQETLNHADHQISGEPTHD
ncbi:ArsR/SmtB family transcription factor [Paenarthrobacter sp. NPDC092416]|uniref:ArsR/SmtB family transcription factor n=1 Tax=Paenarthrobacter sp. NPDC092416 TaxID=3364386 RepID=UPI0038127731